MKKRFSVKSCRFALVLTGIVIVATLIVSAILNNSIVDTIAVNNEVDIEVMHHPDILLRDDDGVYVPKRIRANDGTLTRKQEGDHTRSGDGLSHATESKYDTRDTITTVRIKNQGREQLCWAYSASTVLEFLFAKKGIQIEFSPKVWDYRFVEATEAYKENGVRNKYYEKLIEAWSEDDRTLGGTMDFAFGYLLLFNDPLALVRESDFFGAMKENDSRFEALGVTNTYDEMWKSSGIYTQLTNYTTTAGRVYNEKQSYSKVNDPSVVDYILTGAERIAFKHYKVSEDPDNPQIKRVDVIQDIKDAIKTYGAVNAIFGVDNDPDVAGENCTHSLGNDLIYINKNTTSSKCGGSHVAALVGWDDDFTFYFDGEWKKGAFIVQNSYGNPGLVSKKYYLTYDSNLLTYSYNDIVEYDAYDNKYALSDYTLPAESTTNEHVYSFKADDDEKLMSFTFTDVTTGLRQFDILISSGANGDVFTKVNSEPFSTHSGINKYVFDRDVRVKGDFKIKLLKTSGSDIDLVNRYYNNVLLFTDDVVEPDPTPDDPSPDDPTPDDPTPDDPDDPTPDDPTPDDPTPDDPTPDDPTPDDPTPDDPTPDDPTPDDPTPDDPTPDDPTPDEPTPTPDEEDIPVPNTSTDTPKGVSTPNTGAVTSNSEGGIWSNLVMVPVVVVVGVIVCQVSIKISKHPKFGHKDYE